MSVTPNCKQISVAPLFDVLPKLRDDGISNQALVFPCKVFTVLLADLHGPTFQYEALRVAAAQVIKCLHGPGAFAMTAVRAFAGLSPGTPLRSPSVVEKEVFGEAGSPERTDFLKCVQKQMKTAFSAKQSVSIREFHGPLFVANCAAGAGKTNMIVALALGVLRSEHKSVLHISEPNRALVQEIYRLLLISCDTPDIIVPVGADESDGTDMLNTFLDEVALRGTAVNKGTTALLDQAIEHIWRYLLWYRHTWSHTRADHVAVLRALCHMLAQREKYLIQHVYKDMYDKKKAAMKNVRVMIHTHSFFLKYTAELCNLPKGFDTDDGPMRCLLVDEVHQHDFMELLAGLPGVQWCGLLGDEMQQKGKGHQRRTSAGEMPVPHRQRDTQDIAALDWLKSSDIWTFNLQQTYRTGGTVVSLLKQVFRNQLCDLVSIRSTDTLVLLTLFEDTESNYDDHSGEITSS
jgi:hypothetical protein